MNKLEVSRSPVRETEHDMQDIFEVRISFESIGIRNSIANLTDEIRDSS
jgi:DNA-binding GntR family transcriptional regulator